MPKIWDAQGNIRPPSELKEVRYDTGLVRDAMLGLLNSSLFYWLITVWSDCRNLNQREVDMTRFDVGDIDALEKVSAIARELMDDIAEKSEVKKQGKLTIQQTFPRLSKTIIDRVDTALAEHYGFTDEELDFIINYDIEYRMGRS